MCWDKIAVRRHPASCHGPRIMRPHNGQHQRTMCPQVGEIVAGIMRLSARDRATPWREISLVAGKKSEGGASRSVRGVGACAPEGWPRDDLFHDLSAGAVTRPRWSVALCPRLAGCRHGSRAAPAWYRLIVAKRLVRGQWDDIGRYGAFPHVHRPETRGKPPFLRICRRRSHFVRALKALSRLLVSPSRPLRWLLPICLWARRFWRDPLPAPSRTILALNRMIQERASHHPGSFSELPPCEGPLVS